MKIINAMSDYLWFIWFSQYYMKKNQSRIRTFIESLTKGFVFVKYMQQ